MTPIETLLLASVKSIDRFTFRTLIFTDVNVILFFVFGWTCIIILFRISLLYRFGKNLFASMVFSLAKLFNCFHSLHLDLFILQTKQYLVLHYFTFIFIQYQFVFLYQIFRSKYHFISQIKFFYFFIYLNYKFLKFL